MPEALTRPQSRGVALQATNANKRGSRKAQSGRKASTKRMQTGCLLHVTWNSSQICPEDTGFRKKAFDMSFNELSCNTVAYKTWPAPRFMGGYR